MEFIFEGGTQKLQTILFSVFLYAIFLVGWLQFRRHGMAFILEAVYLATVAPKTLWMCTWTGRFTVNCLMMKNKFYSKSNVFTSCDVFPHSR